ncbi:MAG: hypothetical protein HBSAPP04_11810 [Ignavibacteriaceae bacterium]|nr:MAG: hypothetical protein HBSAPP04_11810 [Ignavibacteriaceae bacterium]
MSNTLYLCVAVFVAGALLGGLIMYKVNRPSDIPEIPVQKSIVTVTDTVTVEKLSVLERIKPVFSTDTVWITRVSAEGDPTLEEVAAVPVFEAGVDTVMFDSLLTLGVRFTSPVPLDTRSRFTLRASLKERTVTEKETVHVRDDQGWLHFGIVLAPGYGFLQNKTDVFIGMGIMVAL